MCSKKFYFLFILIILGFIFYLNYFSSSTSQKNSIDPSSFVVGIKANQGGVINWGTGFVVNKEEGFVATAKHVVETIEIGDCTSKIIVSNENNSTLAQVIWKHPNQDLAIIHLVNNNLNTTEITPGSLNNLRDDDQLKLIGYQFGYKERSFAHVLRIIKTRIYNVDTDPEAFIVNPVNSTLGFLKSLSGSPLLDNHNKVVGIFFKYLEYDMFLIPIQEIPKGYFGVKK